MWFRYGVHSDSSDYDIMVIVDDRYEVDVIFNVSTLDLSFGKFSNEILDVTIVPLRYFINMLFEHRHDAIACFYVPEKFRLMEKESIEFEIDTDVYWRTVNYESRQRFYIGKKKWVAGHHRDAKKDVIHSMRYLCFAMQIFTFTKITDFTAANEWYFLIMSGETDEWDFQYWENVRRELLCDFNNISHANFYNKIQCNIANYTDQEYCSYDELFPDLPSDNCPYHQSLIMDTLFNKGFHDLLFENCLNAIYDQNNQLVHISPLMSSDIITDISNECYQGLVLDMNNYRIKCKGLPRAQEIFAPPEDFTLYDIYEYIDGTLISLYFANGAWRTSTKYGFAGNIMMDPKSTPSPLDEVFWSIWSRNNFSLPEEENFIFHFILKMKQHRYVVKNTTDDIVLISVMENEYLKEIFVDQIAEKYLFKMPRKFLTLPNINTPFEYKGFIFHERATKLRYSLKLISYYSILYGKDEGPVLLNLNHGISDVEIFSLVRLGMADSLAVIFPQMEQKIFIMKRDFDAMADEISSTYSELLQTTQSKKQFSQLANKLWYSPVLFSAMKRSRGSIRELFALMEQKSYDSFLKKKNYQRLKLVTKTPFTLFLENESGESKTIEINTSNMDIKQFTNLWKNKFRLDNNCVIEMDGKKVDSMRDIDVSKVLILKVVDEVIVQHEEKYVSGHVVSDFKWVPVCNGYFTLSPRPGKKKLYQISRSSCTHVLTLLGSRERAPELGKQITNMGIEWIWLPLDNGNVPEEYMWDDIFEGIKKVSTVVMAGGFVLIHCSAGLHRTGMIANVMLQYLGYNAEESLQLISEARSITSEKVGDHRLEFTSSFISHFGTYKEEKTGSHQEDS